MNTKVLSEDEFFYFHENLKRNGARIIRCIQSRTPHGIFYTLTWKDK